MAINPNSPAVSRRADVMPSGSLKQFEAWLGSPPWFRAGTALPVSPEPIPPFVAIADDLRVLANIVDNGGAGTIIQHTLNSPRPPHSPGWFAAVSLAPTLQDSIDMLITEIPWRNSFVAMSRTTIDGFAAIRSAATVEGSAGVLAGLMPLLLVYRHIMLQIGEPGHVSLLDITIDHDSGLDDVLRAARLDPRWRADANSLLVPLAWLNHRNIDGDPVLWKIASERLQLPAIPNDKLVMAVSAHIADVLASSGTTPKLGETASALGSSERSLVRRLGACGWSFSQAIEAEKKARATMLLADAANSLQSIAERLGYPDKGSFGRAFRRWSGDSPARYRRRLLERA